MNGGFFGLYNFLPFIIQIFMKNNKLYVHHCSGSLISYNWVLTAGHCVEIKNISKYYLGGGRTISTYKLTYHGNLKFLYGQTRRVKNIYLPVDYNRPGLSHDIALVQPRVPFKNHGGIYPIKLPISMETGDLTKKFKYCYSAGWGSTGANTMMYYDPLDKRWKYNSKDLTYPKNMVNLILPLISNKDCGKIYLRHRVLFDIRDWQICTLYYPGRKSLCRGDSGSPLICGSELYGLSSWSYGCGTPRIGADVHTRVDKFLYWINETIFHNSEDDTSIADFRLDNEYYDSVYNLTITLPNISFIVILIFYYIILKLLV